MLESLVEKNEKGRARFLRLNRAAEKAILVHLKEQSSDVKDNILKAIVDFRKILESKPKQLLSAYMKFSIAQGKTPALEGLRLEERAPKVKEAWAKLTDEKKDEFKPSSSERKKYDSDRSNFESKIKSFKSQKN
jgi:hypothetical protein